MNPSTSDLFQLARQAHLQGNLHSAEELYHRTLTGDPNHPEALHALGVLYHQVGKNNLALDVIGKAIACNSHNSQYYYHLGIVRLALGENEAALDAFKDAIRIKSNNTEALFNSGLILKAAGQLDAAIQSYQQAARWSPGDAAIHYNLANAFLEIGHYDNAIIEYKRALELNPAYAEAFNNIGIAYKETGRVDKSIKSHEKAIKLRADYAEAHWNLALVLLTNGNFLAGWREYEWRYRKADWQTVYPRRFEIPRWEGQHFADRNLLIHCEQGLGDVLQFVRYIPLVKARGGQVTFEVYPELIDLVRGTLGIDHLEPFSYYEPPQGDYDFYIPLLSLPGIFHTTIATIPANGPYIRAAQSKIDYWQTRLANSGFRIGLVWSGKKTDSRRTCPPEHLSPLLKIDGIQWIGLQKSDNGSPLKGLANSQALQNLGDDFSDFTDTAAAIANLDLVISIDTSVAHLAGAMGKPVWLLLPQTADWRWLLNREDSPWYPSMRIFRQNRPGDWDSLIRRVANELDQTVRAQQQHITYKSSAKAAYYFNIANTNKHDGRYEVAVDNYRKAIEHQADFAEAFYNLANTLNLLGRTNDAIENYRAALKYKPDFADAYNNLGTALENQKEFAEAESSYRQAIYLKPDYADAYNNLGNLYHKMNRLQHAVDCYQKAIDIQPDRADIYYNLAQTLKDRNQFDLAIETYQKALRLKPDFADAYNNLGVTFQEQGMPADALENYKQAIKLDANFADAHWNYALALLLTENFHEGWKEFEWRFHKNSWQRTYPFRYNLPRWDGLNFEGKRLYVHDEQGFGDTLQFIRYLPLVKARGGKVFFETRQPLLNLLTEFCGIDELVERSDDGKPAVPSDCYIPLLSLPGIFQTTLKSIPAKKGYLSANECKVKYWRKQLDEKDYKVGLVWAGNSSHVNDKKRSIALQRFAPLAELPGIQLYGLQKGEAAKQDGEICPSILRRNLGEHFEDFSETAGAIQNLDLVISVDTSVAHLAGAMGKPVWTILPFAPDWRWLLKRKDSPWYPTMKIFRQPEPGDWESVIDQVKDELQALVSRKESNELPQAGPSIQRPADAGGFPAGHVNEGNFEHVSKDELLYLAMPPPAENFGWGLCSKYFSEELSKFIKIHNLDFKRNSTEKLHISGKVFHALTGINFDALFAGVRGTENFAYTFFENELNEKSIENAKKYNLILGGSSWCRDRMLEKGIKNCGVLIQGIDSQKFFPITKEKNQNRFIVFSGGKFELRKGQDLVLKAIKILQEKYDDIILVNCWANMWPESMHLMSSSPYITYEYKTGEWHEVMSHIYRLNGLDEKRIMTIGLVPNETQRELYQQTDIGVFPNRCEGGTNLVLMEYMACAKPVIASNTSGHKDIINEQNAMLLNDLRDFTLSDSSKAVVARWQEPSLDELIAQLEFAYHHRDMIKTIGKSAGEDLKQFTWQKSAQQLVQHVY